MVNKEYDYIRGTTALNPKRRYEEERKRQERENIEKQRREQKRKQIEAKKVTVKNILQVASIALILGVLTVARDGNVYKLQNNLTNLKNDVKSVSAQNEALRANLLKIGSIEEINAAASNAGMKIPKEGEIVSVTITKDFFANIRE